MIKTATKQRWADRAPPSQPWGQFDREKARHCYEQCLPQVRTTPCTSTSAPPLPDGPPAATAPPPQQASPAPPSIGEALMNVARQAEEGDEASLKRLRQFLDENPEVWRRAGDIGAVAERAWIEAVAEDNGLLCESVPRRLRELKSELAGGDATPLEMLLVDLVGVTWLAAKHAELRASISGGSLQQATFRLKRAESAQRRFLGAIKTLAKIRALLPRAGAKTVASGSGP
jgi:hypothetical protein